MQNNSIAVTNMHIFDAVQPSSYDGIHLLWNCHSDCNKFESIIRHYENYFYEIRAEFLRFIHNFSEYSIDGRHLSDYIRLQDGFSAWWLSSLFERHPAFYGQGLFEIFKLRALERYLATLENPFVYLHSANSVLADIMRELCIKKNIPFKHDVPFHKEPASAWYTVKKGLRNSCVGKAYANLRHRIKNSRAYALYFLTRSTWRWWHKYRSFFPQKPKLKNSRGLLLGTWFPNIDANEAEKGIFRSKYWEGVHDLLEGYSRPVHWFFVHAEPAEKIRENVRLRDSFASRAAPNVDMTFWEECVTLRGVANAWLSSLRIALKARPLRKHLELAAVWPNSDVSVFPFIKAMWEDSTQGEYLLHRLLCLEGVRHYCTLIGAQETLITSSELQFWERMLFREQRRLGCQRIYAAQHSVIREADFRFFCDPRSWELPEFLENMPDKFYANGPIALESLRSAGFPEERLGCLEAVRFMHLTRIRRHKVCQPNRLLVATSYFAADAERTLQILAEAMHRGKIPLFSDVIIKPHPYLPLDDMLPRIFDDPPPIVQGRIEEYFEDNVAVFADSATSVGLLAYHSGLPLIISLPENSFNMGMLQKESGIAFIRNSMEFLSALKKIDVPQVTSEYFYLDQNLPEWRKTLSLN